MLYVLQKLVWVGFRVEGLGFRVSGFGFRVSGLGGVGSGNFLGFGVSLLLCRFRLFSFFTFGLGVWSIGLLGFEVLGFLAVRCLEPKVLGAWA